LKLTITRQLFYVYMHTHISQMRALSMQCAHSAAKRASLFVFSFIAVLLPIALSAQSVELSDSEKAWIATHPEIRVGIDANWHPIEFVDPQGKYSGLSADYLNLLNERLGLDMQAAMGLSWPEVVEGTKNNAFDVLICVRSTSSQSRVAGRAFPLPSNWPLQARP
ncbi:MAG: transporter substrate-binding domain-containing protein, partial [Candidatus Latescibacterota bacterium]